MITEHVSSTHWDSHNAFTKFLLAQNTLYLKIQFQFNIYECDCLFFTQTRPQWFNHCQYIFHQHPAFQIDAFKPIMKKNELWLLQIIQNVPNIYHMYPLKKYLYLLHWCCFFVHNLIMSRTIQLCLSWIDFWFLAISNSKWFSVLRFMFYEKKPLPIRSPFHTHFNKQLFPILDDAKYIPVNV